MHLNWGPELNSVAYIFFFCNLVEVLDISPNRCIIGYAQMDGLFRRMWPVLFIAL